MKGGRKRETPAPTGRRTFTSHSNNSRDHGTTDGALRNVFDFAVGLRKNLSYLAERRMPCDGLTLEAQRIIASKLAMHAAVALEHGEGQAA